MSEYAPIRGGGRLLERSSAMQNDRMKVRQIWVGIAVGAILIQGSGATAQAQVTAQRLERVQTQQERVPAQEIGPEEFRDRLIAWALASEQTFPGPDLAEKIAALSDEQIEIWLSTIEDPEAFVGATERVASRLLDQATGTPWTEDEEAPTGLEPDSPPPLTTPFPPDYPPNSGPYRTEIIDDIAFFGITGASSTNRCGASSWGDFVGVWWPLNKAFDTLDGACIVAGCDPTGIVCASVCGVLETAKVALKVAAAPLEACDVHQGAIDGAEIEATYENTLGLVGDVSHVHDDLADHDADIKALIGNIEETVEENQRLIKVLMSRQLEVMRLLITPAGTREINENVLTCTGDDCPVFPATPLCPNGSLKWNCVL
jgi:hypothetical protein